MIACGKLRLHITSASLALLLALPAAAQDARRGAVASDRIAVAVPATHGMVVAQEKRAARVGADILAKGGNAIDAAVATGFAIAVTYPRAGNIGGGGFMLIHRADGRDVAIDSRETAPAAATPTMFLTDGKADPAKSRDGALGIGVPGTVAGLALALRDHGSGRFTLAQLLAPAIALARDGFPLDDDGADTLPEWHRRLARWPSSTKIFSRSDGSSLRDGDLLVQRDLAATLEKIAAEGPRGFYEGDVAESIARGVRDAGGIMTSDDLKSYTPIIRTPLRGTYRGFDIVAMPQPSSGGVVLLETLNILEGFDVASLGQGTPASLHLLVEAMKRAYADRARYLGDPAFTSAPIEKLISKEYAATLRTSIDPQRATPARDVAPIPRSGDNTTHFSVIDGDGNAVSTTTTLNFSYGVGLVAEGTGVLLNNELDDFTAAVGASNAYGLTGFEANLPGPGKRPLSSMTPTIVLRDGRVVIVTGSPGGSRIISTVIQVLVNAIDHRMGLADAVSAPRLHHQWLPDEIRIENGFPDATLAALRAMGHAVRSPMGQTSANSIMRLGDTVVGAPDPRTRGSEAAVQP